MLAMHAVSMNELIGKSWDARGPAHLPFPEPSLLPPGPSAVICLSKAFVAVLLREELLSDAERREGAGAWRTARQKGGDCLRTVMFLAKHAALYAA